MAVIHELIEQIQDANLRQRIEEEVRSWNKRRKFGLVFEEHTPENTLLYDVPVKRGALVAKRDIEIKDLYVVIRIDGENAICEHTVSHEQVTMSKGDIVVVAKLGDPIYPYLKPMETVQNAPDSELWHTLIEADNYHALQLLAYLYAGQVDCIYIDPPYNSGARDWKYNNDYVDGNDSYRHSKWLSMMEKRLLLAKKLLKPNDSVLIVTIDEKEYNHLGCLLEQMFPSASITMISTIINRKGAIREGDFSRVNEYIFYVRLGEATICKQVIEGKKKISWQSFVRGNFRREEREHMFYAIHINKTTNKIENIDDFLPLGVSKDSVMALPNCDIIFPMSGNREAIWRLDSQSARNINALGYLKVRKFRDKYSLSYLSSGTIKDIADGVVKVVGYDENGYVRGYYPEGVEIPLNNQWDFMTHNATEYGSILLKNMFCDKVFS